MKFGERSMGLLLLSLVASSLAVGCSKDRRAAMEASKTVLKGHLEATQSDKGGADQIEETRFAIYIDASLSMQGYARCRAEESEFSRILGEATAYFRTPQVMRFGQVRGRPSADFTPVQANRDIGCPDFYTLSQNPDQELYRRVRDKEPGVVSIYFTDGVLSDETGLLPTATTDELMRWLDQGGRLGLAVFRATYQGRLWSEQRGSWVPDGPREWTGTVPERPFYAFIFARTEGALQETLRELQRIGRDNWVGGLRFGPWASSCEFDAASGVYQRDGELPWVALRSRRNLNELDVGTVRCVLPEHSALESISVDFATDYLRWVSGSLEEAPNLAGAQFRTHPSVRSHELELRLSLSTPEDRGARYGFHLTRMQAATGSPVAWISDLDTDSDAEPEHANRTFRFRWVVDVLLAREVEQAGELGRFGTFVIYP